VILAGRRINDGMGPFIAQRVIKMLIDAERKVKGAKVGIIGLTFKEEVPDLRNSRVPDILAELRSFGIEALVHDPMADREEALHEYGVKLVDIDAFDQLDALILAVPHRVVADRGPDYLSNFVAPGGIFVDVKSAFREDVMPKRVSYWSL
jgi:UDP-N-acetyl-D-galactosamine dehydrogenase